MDTEVALKLASAFALSLTVNFFYAWYVRAVTRRSALSAASCSLSIVAIGSTMTILVVQSPYCIAATMAGAFIGTFLIVR